MRSTLSRRGFIAAGAALAAPMRLSLAQGTVHARADDARFVFVLLRGGLDGLAAVPAIGDPHFASARGALAQFHAEPLPLDGTPFALHPNLTAMHAAYRRGEALVVHATGLATYHERSHFDAQKVLESGGVRPYELATGWLGRALAAMGSRSAMAMTTAVPLVMRGSDRVDTWAPSVLPEPSSDLVARLEMLYAGDAQLRDALARAKSLRAAAPEVMSADGNNAGGARSQAVTLARKAGEFLAAERGPRLAVIELGGWDTHANQMGANAALANNLRTLDDALDALRASLGAAWSRSVVLVATEFGREVAANGTLGSDHGTGGAAFVLGGAVKGGRVIADWPGLAKADRFEGRDLRVTTDLRAVMKGLLVDHLRLPPQVVESDVLPGAATAETVSLMA
jgi:uncharacterized protein (DUF1501 family)